MLGRSRAKRGRQGAASGSTSAIPLVPEHPLVRFRDQPHRAKFVELMGKRINSTRFLDRQFMSRLGLEPMLMDVFTGMGLPALLGMYELTYESLTLEFLSSYNYNNVRGGGDITFRLMNQEVVIRVGDIANYFEIIRDGSECTDPPTPFNIVSLWSGMTGIPPNRVNIDRMRTNEVQHPGLRMALRTIVGTIFARPDVSKLNKTDLHFIGSYLNPCRQAPFRMDAAHFLAVWFQKGAKGKFKSIEFGGLITLLAKKHFGLDEIEDYKPASETIPLLNDSWLINHHHWVERIPRGSWKWLVSPGRWMTLPCNHLQPLLPLPESSPGHAFPTYVIPLELTEEGGGPPAPRAPVPQVPHPPPNLGDVHNMPYMRHPTSSYPIPQYDPNSFENRRHCHEAVMQGMANYRLFEHMEQLGIHQPTDIAPSYYAGVGNYPGTLFEDYGVSRDAWGPAYGQSYGGLGGQFLPGGSQYGDGSTYAQAGYDPNVYSSGYYGGSVPGSQGVGLDSNVAGPSGGHDDDDGQDDDYDDDDE